MRFAISYTDFNENVLKVKIVEAKDWKQAADRSGFLPDEEHGLELTTLDKLRDDMFDQDSLIEITEIPLSLDEHRLHALEQGGVDNWDWYSESLSSYQKATGVKLFDDEDEEDDE